MFWLPSSFLLVLKSSASPSTSSFSSSPKLIRLFPRLWAGSCSCRLFRSTNATQRGELPWWQVQRWTQSTHTLWGRANKLRSGLGVVGDNDVGIITFRNEVWDECIHALYHPRRGTQQTRRHRVGRAFCVQLRRLFTHNSYVRAWIPLREARWRTNYAWTCAPVGLSSAATHDRGGFYSHIFI